MDAFDVAVVGDNTIDRFLDEPSLGDLVGGNALNVAVQLHLLGVAVRYFGVIGDDADGDVVKAAMLAAGLDTAGLRVVAGPTALTCIRRRDDGDRYFETESFGVTGEYAPTRAEVEAIRAARWVHIGMLPEAHGFRAAVREGAALALSQDCSVSEGYSDLTVAFMSAGESDDAAEAGIRDALSHGVDTAVATLGARGAVAGHGAERLRVASPATEVIDTTGAGDSFMAGYIAATLRGADRRGALEAGVVRGGFTCRYVGGWPQLAGDVTRFGGR
jgi:fructoselysine 6-kinase